MADEHHHDEIEPPGEFEVPSKFKVTALIFALVGIVAFVAGLFLDPDRAWRGYIIGFWFTFSLAAAGPFFIATQYVSKAGWSVAIRRIPEAMGSFLYPSILFGALALLGAEYLFGWLALAPEVFDPASDAFDPIVAEKEAVLNLPALAVATLGGTILIAGFYWLLRKQSLLQDDEGGYDLMHKNIWTSAFFIIAFVIGFSFLSWYWMMSYDPHWYSMMWSVYAFAGLFQSGLAVMTLILLYLLAKGHFGDCAGTKHVHLMGQLVFAFTCFYAYIHMGQFLLLWYANIPETAKWYVDRWNEGWGPLMLAIPLFKFIIPFFALLRRDFKKNKHNVLAIICGLVIFMQAYEIWIWVMPYHYGPEGLVAPSIPVFEVLITLGFVGIFMYVVARSLARHSLVPLKDPLLDESIPHSHDHLIYPNGKPGETEDDQH